MYVCPGSSDPILYKMGHYFLNILYKTFYMWCLGASGWGGGMVGLLANGPTPLSDVLGGIAPLPIGFYCKKLIIDGII